MNRLYALNRKLLENYPSVWNTKLVWMLLISFVIHVVFFFIGYFSFSDPSSLQKGRAVVAYFDSGLIFIHLIISVLMIVGWLIAMFKNNAFKSFYPVSRFKLFGQFFQYFIIVLSCITFYFPYMEGAKLYVKGHYDDKKMAEDIDVINRAYPFLALNIEDYTLDNRSFPSVFSDLYCETSTNNIHHWEPYFSFQDRGYQFYSLYSKTVYEKDSLGNFKFPDEEKRLGINEVYTLSKPASVTYFFKKDVVDVSQYVKSADPSFYNFSKVFFKNKADSYNIFNGSYREPYYYDETNINEQKKHPDNVFVNKSVAQLLDKKDSKAMERLMKEFLDISKEYKIKNNLDLNSWLKMVYHPDDFTVNHFVKRYDRQGSYDYYDTEAMYADAVVDSAIATVDAVGTVAYAEEKDLVAEYFKARLTNHYYYEEDLKTLLENVDEIKNTDYILETLHIFFWIAFGVSALVFCFRTSGLKNLLFSIITTGVVSLVLMLILVLLRMGYYEYYAHEFEFSASFLAFLVLSLFIFAPFVLMKKLNRMATSIALNIGICGFPFWLLLILLLIDIRQKNNCITDNMVMYNDCPTIIDTLGILSSYGILVLSFVFLYFYISQIQKWKAKPY